MQVGTNIKLGDQAQPVAEELNAKRAELRVCTDLHVHMYSIKHKQGGIRHIPGYHACA